MVTNRPESNDPRSGCTARNAWRAGSAVVAFVGTCFLASPVLAQNCPATDPNQNYNCPVGPLYTLPPWGNIPWSLSPYYSTIVAADLDGDGRDELLGRDSTGVRVWSFSTSLGIWQPWITTDGKGILVLPLSDALQWDQPEYGSTIKPMTFPGRTGKVLAARGIAGVVLYALARGQGPGGLDLPAGTWTPLTASGPLADSDCFNSNSLCWNSAPYYQTLRFGDVDGQPGDELVAWGGDGGVAFKWNGSAWIAFTGFPVGVDAAQYPASALTLQFADIDGEPGQELVNWDQGGLNVHKYVPGPNGGAWSMFPQVNLFGVSCLDAHGSGLNASCWSTLTTASIGPGGVAAFIRIPGCDVNGNVTGGMAGARWNPGTKAWEIILQQGPFNDCNGFDQPQYYQTIQFARITGNAVPELVGRGPGGILVYHWNGSNYVPLSTNVPALADSTWALDASYWQSIGTANVDGSGRASLIARGQTGVRTWLWQGAAFTRPQPYGGFPAFTGDQATAYNLLNQFLNLAQGTIRDTYTNPAVDNTASALRNYVSQIVNVRGGCHVEVSANPPQYQTCDPVVGATNPAYTTMVNQIIKELSWAASVVDRFTTVQTVQGQLFAVQGTEFPSIADNLQLPQATGPTEVEYFTLFSRVEALAGAITGLPLFNIESAAINVGLSALPFFQGSPKTTYSATYANVQGQIATLQQSLQTSNLAQKHFVLSDYALLSTVGQLVASQAWTIDEAAYLSASRQAFTEWVYRMFLVNLWSFYTVVGCGQNEDSTIECYPPPNGGNMQYYQSFQDANGTYVNFNGILPNANPICYESCQGDNPPTCANTCQFPAASATTVNVLTTPVSPQCTYNAQAGTAWVYANPNATPPVAGCTLGATPALFAWDFPVVPINTNFGAMAIDQESAVTGIGGDARLRLGGISFSNGGAIDLRTATVTVTRLLDEPGFAGELVRNLAGGTFAQTTLRPTIYMRGRLASYETAAGVSPRLRVDMRMIPPARDLRFELQADAMQIAEPLRCVGAPPATKLRLNVVISGGGLPAPRTLAQVQDWQCVFDSAGRLTALRPIGNAAFRLGSP